ncbi:ceruloplasmin [Erpetoichthys calabaricus]|uniref:Hephaestin n=1 Tax=Erpetoichthys calabaricus TaxID=27687 RepID=A0A8C4X824_ERPCA|nr:ceruloplasmin [Erpetoichthys calabaricus]
MIKFNQCLILMLIFASTAYGVTRKYYLGIEEIEWDYAPSKINLILNKPVAEDEHAAIFLLPGPDRIGSIYKKAVFQQFTNSSYKEKIQKQEWLGFLGPILAAEEGDTVIVHLKNFASRPYSLHSHGVKYDKKNEGAFYPDNTTNEQKQDDHIYPGQNFTYTWEVSESHAPTTDDDNCMTWIYHSHIDAPKDISSGLIGPLITCKKGYLDIFGEKEADYMFALMFSVVDENLSWYLDDNIKKYCSSPDKVDKDNEDFQESNKMHSINGYVYGNLPGLAMCSGSKIRWHLFGMGNEVDVHSAFFHGQILTDRNHHVDTISLFPATFVSAKMVPRNPGKWLLSCQVNDHVEAGMQAYFQVNQCFPPWQQAKINGVERRYFIAAEEVLWDYGPTGKNLFTGDPLTVDSEAQIFFENGPHRIGGKYKKAVFTEYTDESFKARKKRNSSEEHLGILGPVIRAEVGDTIHVTFWNNASYPFSIQPHGVQYTKNNEGAFYSIIPGRHETLSPASHVLPGENFTYEWTVPEDTGPMLDDPDCITWFYYSAVDSIKDTNSGLVGPLLVCKKRTLVSGKQKNVGKEFHLLSTVFDENLSWYLDDNIKIFAQSPNDVDKENEDFQESNKMHSINGYMFGNLPGLNMCKGEKVSWHITGLGTEVDIHSIFFQGNTFLMKGMRRDVVSVFPHTSETVIMEPDALGRFNVKCRTTDHLIGGMKQFYQVEKCQWWNIPFNPITFHEKTYYIAAEEVEWDYSPDRTWETERHQFQNESPGNAFIEKEDKFIGSKYKKVVYREYTNSKFNTLKERGEDEMHLEILGPLIHGNVDDRIKIVFKNNASRPYSIHAQGVKTESPKVYTTSPGEVHTYTWYIPKRSGPGDSDFDCNVWAYFSTVDAVKDMFSGLVGPLIICKKRIRETLGLKKKQKEFALLFMIFDENQSWYLDENIQTYIHNSTQVQKDSEEFMESNMMHAINGKIYGNLKGLTMTAGEKVSWYLMGFGNEVDLHTAHFHGHSFDYKMSGTHRADVFDLFPATLQTLEMTPQYPGNWLLHCHVTDHIHSGMETTYTVLEKEESKSTFKNIKSFLKEKLG